MQRITEAAHAHGVVMLWDLAHSAGAVPIDISSCRAEFAAGCTYKYLNGGPGAPAFIYIRPDIVSSVEPALAGWLGHDEPFAFESSYRAAKGIQRMRVGTPAVLQMAALEQALSLWDEVDMAEVRRESIALSELFISEVERRCPQLTLVSPREAAQRGSQVSFSFEHGYAAVQAMIERNVISDFRAPDVMRFGFTPLYIDAHDVRCAVTVLSEVINNRLWDSPRYRVKAGVT